MNVQKIEKDVWVSQFSEDAHLVCFEKHKPREFDRIDYALFVTDEGDRPCGYITVREVDCDTCYWQFGGAFPGTRGGMRSWEAYRACIDWTRKRYKRIVTYIENTNRPMLRMASNADFLITGVRNFKGSVLLEHSMEFENGDQ